MTEYDAYMEDSRPKYLTVEFPDLDLTYTSGDFNSESMRLKEMLIAKDSMEFVGCISTFFKIGIADLDVDVKGSRITASIWTPLSQGEPARVIGLFTGYVESVTNTSNREIVEVSAYDALWTAADADVKPWWDSLTFPITMLALRNSLFEYLDIEQEQVSLVNDNVTIAAKAEVKELSGLDMIKKICTLNGVCGHVSPEGVFKYIELADSEDPEEDLLIRKYRSVKYEGFKVKKITKVILNGVEYGTGRNKYVITENVLTAGMDADALESIAHAIHGKVSNFSYRPYTAKNNGLPFLELGSWVRYRILNKDRSSYSNKSFPVLARELTGIQSLKDTYSAKGQEDQRLFETDMQSQVDSLKDEIDNTPKFELVDEEPEQWEENTVYFVRKE